MRSPTESLGATLIVTTNTTDLSTTFSISSLTSQTTVSDISVSAYTSIGRGEAATLADQTILEEPREFLLLNWQVYASHLVSILLL